MADELDAAVEGAEAPESNEKAPNLGIDNFGDVDLEAQKDGSSDKAKKKSADKADDKANAKSADKKDDKPPAPRKRKARLGEDTELEWDDDGADDVDFSKLTIKRKVDGKDVDVPISRLAKDYELRQASYNRLEQNNDRDRRFKEAIQGLAQNRAQMEDFLRDHAGIEDPYQWAMDGLKERIEEEQLAQTNPQEWRTKQQARMQREFQAQQRREQRMQQQQIAAQQEQEAGRRFIDAITQGREQHGLGGALGLGALHIMEQRFGRMGRDSRAEVGALLSEAADLYRSEIQSHVRGLSPEQVLDLMGPQLVRQLNEFQVKRAKGNTKAAPKPKEETEKKPAQPPRKYKSEREITRELYGNRG